MGATGITDVFSVAFSYLPWNTAFQSVSYGGGIAIHPFNHFLLGTLPPCFQ